LRYSTVPIDASNWIYATRVSSVPLPGAPGTTQSVTLAGLPAPLTYYFAIKTSDERGNWSGLSNIATHAPGAAGVAPGLEIVEFAPASPNPARSGTRFAFTLPRPGRV